MKRKNLLSENATKGDLLILKQDIKQEMQALVSGLDEKNEKYKDEVLTKLDDISGQLGDLQEDKVLSIHQTEELRERIDGHEKRIKNMEKAQQTA